MNGLDLGALADWANAKNVPLDIAEAIFEIVGSDNEADALIDGVNEYRESHLVPMYSLWCKAQGLRLFSADELAVEPTTSPQQVAWLSNFIKVWDWAESK